MPSSSEEARLHAVVNTAVHGVILIDPAGVVDRAYYTVKATGHVARLRNDLGI